MGDFAWRGSGDVRRVLEKARSEVRAAGGCGDADGGYVEREVTGARRERRWCLRALAAVRCSGL